MLVGYFNISIIAVIIVIISYLLWGLVMGGYFSLTPYWRKEVKNQLVKILQQKTDLQWQILQLHKLAHYCLKKSFQIDSSFSEILKLKHHNFTKQIIDDLWFANRVRNQIAHNPNPVSKEHLVKAKQILTNFIKNH